MDFTPLEETEYYTNSKEVIASIPVPRKDTSQVEVGWAKENITPSFDFKVIGFGKNDYCEKVMDSVFIRAIVFKQKDYCVAYLSYDLMIIHPVIVQDLEKKLKEQVPEIDHVYYSATHTHNGIGGYGDKISGYVALGGKDQRILDLLTNSAIACITKSLEKRGPAEYLYSGEETEALVKNRFDKEYGEVDKKLRVLYLKNTLDKKVAFLTTFAAHATSLGRRQNELSSDYPGAYCKLAEENKLVDFALFSAGGVGSHESNLSEFTEESKNGYAKEVYEAHKEIYNSKVDTSQFKPLNKLNYEEIEIPLRDPHLKIGLGLRLRPWAFQMVFGEGTGKLAFLSIGDLMYIGTPCDFSGELILEIEEELKNVPVTPIITSFNGEYIGYITPDKYYLRDQHEVRDVNWFGPYNGRYFSETIVETVKKIE